MKIKEQILIELEQIRRRRGGKLYPRDVVAFARNDKTALHRKFTWDDTEAAEKWRLSQAEELIRVCVIVLPNTTDPVRAYVSLTPDRKPRNGFYRAMADVMNSETMRETMLADAKKDLDSFTTKYELLENVAEMIPVFKAIKKVTGKQRKSLVQAAA